MTEPTSEPTLPPDPDRNDQGWGEPPPDEEDAVRRLREERPPHHDRD